ncbi:hypothetical protein GCM10023085_42140 [Actinomadura viridis]|uniref:Uncharacterized protein n=1 Tax=Actinomadura viridis TaxID=58110 RepID=A0A931GR67_9ACTN|nr:hypothetical protein [Actinomadura viridis]MBG6092511.1 hypothetical protein [Actinomadura viridis]
MGTAPSGTDVRLVAPAGVGSQDRESAVAAGIALVTGAALLWFLACLAVLRRQLELVQSAGAGRDDPDVRDGG